MAGNKVTGSRIIAECLKQEGVETVFTIAGDHILPVLDEMADHRFRFLDTRHEQAAVHMAEAWGRITGGLGVAMYTTPGFANAVPGLASAWHAGRPMLSISGCADLHTLGTGAMQEIDQVSMARPVTKGAWMVTDARRIPDMISTALSVAYSGRRGPVHLTIPVDIQEQVVDAKEVRYISPNKGRPPSTRHASDEQIEEAIALLRVAERPLIIAGSAAAYARSGEALKRLIETTRAPLMTEGDARGLVSDEHPYCLGFFDRGLSAPSRLSGEADVVVLLGRKQDLDVGFAKPPVISADARVVQVDPSAAEIARNRGVDVGIEGDVDAVVGQLADRAAHYEWSDLSWVDRLKAEKEAHGEWFESLAEPTMPMHAAYVFKTAERYLTADDYLSFDGGDFCHFGRSYLPALRQDGWWYLPPLGMLGSAVPVAVALKAAHPDRRVVAFTGDGSFGFNGMEFDTAVRHNLAFVAILGNDSTWGIDAQIQLGLYDRKVATDLLPTRYDQVVRGLGGHGEHVQHPDELDGAIRRALMIERPALVNVEVQNAISPRAQAAIDRWKARTG